MNKLYELAKLNESQKRICEALLPENDISPLKKLYNIISSGKVVEPEEAMLEIYGKSNSAAFSRLKSRLIEILSRTIILQSNPLESSDSRVSAAINVYRQTLVSRFLISKKSTLLGIEFAEKAIVQAMKYHSTENVLILARSLVIYYSHSGYNKYKLAKYLSIQSKYLKLYEWEVKAENYVQELQLIQVKSLANVSEEAINRAAKYKAELESITDIRSYHFNFSRFRVSAIYFEFEKKYEELLKYLDKSFVEFSASDFRAAFAFNSITLRKAWALIQAGRNDEAVLIGEKDMNDLPSGSLAWYFIAHYTLKAELYRGNYINAIRLITKMIENPQFLKIGENYKELFNATLGYIHLIIDSGLIENVDEYKVSLPEFKLYKFLNTIPVYSKDKRGINVSILLMHIAYLLQRKDYNTIIDRVDSLNQYAYRYLRKDDTFRSNCMIKMVIQMTKADFNPIRTERYTKDLLTQLEEVKLAGSGENIETEIIPYEVLWKIMMNTL